jgi:hypothetical protein
MHRGLFECRLRGLEPLAKRQAVMSEPFVPSAATRASAALPLGTAAAKRIADATAFGSNAQTLGIGRGERAGEVGHAGGTVLADPSTGCVEPQLNEIPSAAQVGGSAVGGDVDDDEDDNDGGDDDEQEDVADHELAPNVF